VKYFLLTSLILLSFFTQAKQANSDFGYSMDIPDTWSPLTGPEIKANPELFNFDNVDSVPDPLLQQIIPLIRSGKMDFYFLPDNTNNFADNINVMKQIGEVATTPAKIKETCDAFPVELSKVFQRDIKLYTCEKTQVSGMDALYIKFDGALTDTTTMQYHIKKSENVFLIFTATVKNSSFDDAEADIHQAISTIQLK
jgi:hypothetical protein